MKNETITIPNKAVSEMSFNRSIAVSFLLHTAILIAVLEIMHCFQHKVPLRLPQTITLISFPLPVKITSPALPAPQRVQVGSVKKLGPVPSMAEPHEPAIPTTSAVEQETNPVPSTTSTQEKTESLGNPSGGITSNDQGEIGTPVRIGSIGALDNVEFSPLYNPKPAYPLIALKAGIQGSVDVDLVINEFGRVDEFAIVNVIGHPLFAEETAKVIGKWRFPPPRVGGKKVKIKFLYTVNFKLD
jgi:periplasmic protein TonB